MATNDKTPLIEFLKVEQGWEKHAAETFTQASKDIDAEIMKLAPKTNVSAGLRIEQLNASKKAINEKLSELYGDLGNSVLSAQYKAAAAAVPVSNAKTIAYIQKHDADASLLVDSLTERAQNRLKASMARVQGKSFVPLAKSVYKNESLTKGVVDGIVNSGIANGLSAREIADRVKMHINPNVPGGASYAAMRLGRTEINNAYHATQIEEHINSPWVESVEWNTSGSHKNEDECDHYAEMSPWKKTEVPRKPHPQCFCYMTPVVMDEDDFLDTLFAEKEGKIVDNEMFSGNEALERWLQRTKETIKPVKQLPPAFTSYVTAMDWLKGQASYDGLSSKGKLSSMLAAHQKGNTTSLNKHAKDAKGDVKEAFESITGAKLTQPPQSDFPYPPPKPATKVEVSTPKPEKKDLASYESVMAWLKKQPELADVPYNLKADLGNALLANSFGQDGLALMYGKFLSGAAKKYFDDITNLKPAPAKKKVAPKKTTAKKTAPKKTTTKKTGPALPTKDMSFDDTIDWVDKNVPNVSDSYDLALLLKGHAGGTTVAKLKSAASAMADDVVEKFTELTGVKLTAKKTAPAPKPTATPPPPPPAPKPKLTPAQAKWKDKPEPVKPTRDPDLKMPEADIVPVPVSTLYDIEDLLDPDSMMYSTASSTLKDMKTT